MEKEATQFSTWLAEHRRGVLDDEISAAMSEVVTATQSVGDPKKSGKLTIEIAISCAGPESPTVMLVDKVKIVKPEFARPASVYYLAGDGSLVRNDPMQTRLLPEVGGKSGDA